MVTKSVDLGCSMTSTHEARRRSLKSKNIFDAIREENEALLKQCVGRTPGCVNEMQDGQTPLHVAVMLQKTNAAFDLVVCGARTDIRDNNGDTPLHCAARCGKGIFVSLLSDRKEAEINAKNHCGDTAL